MPGGKHRRGPIFVAWYLVRNVFGDAGWLVLAPMGLAGLVWSGIAIVAGD